MDAGEATAVQSLVITGPPRVALPVVPKVGEPGGGGGGGEEVDWQSMK